MDGKRETSLQVQLTFVSRTNVRLVTDSSIKSRVKNVRVCAPGHPRTVHGLSCNHPGPPRAAPD